MAAATGQPFLDDRGAQPVRGFLHRPTRASGDALVLTHGAGGNAAMPLLLSLAEACAAAGITVLRYDLPFRQARRSGPPSPASAPRDQEGIRAAVEAIRRLHEGRVFAGGQSYGGRQTTMVASGDAGLADGLLLLSYPLHPPGRPDRVRTAHFGQLRTPALFVSGTKDPFGSIEEIAAAARLIPARTRLVRVEDAGHGLLTKANRDMLPGMIVRMLEQFFGTE